MGICFSYQFQINILIYNCLQIARKNKIKQPLHFIQFLKLTLNKSLLSDFSNNFPDYS